MTEASEIDVECREKDAPADIAPALIPPGTDVTWGWGAIHPWDEVTRTALVCFASDRPVRVASGDWQHLQMKDADLSRLKTGTAPLLLDHNRMVDSVIGVIEDAWIHKGSAAFARVRFAKTVKATECWELVLDRVLCHVSMGCYTLRAKDSDPERCFTGPWRPFEISIVPTPADWTVEVAIGRRPDDVIRSAADQAAEAAFGSRETWERWAKNTPLPRRRADLVDAIESEIRRLADEKRAHILAAYRWWNGDREMPAS